MKPAEPYLVMSDPSWVDQVNQPLGPALARAELDRLESDILDLTRAQGFEEAGQPASDADGAPVDSVEPPD